MFNRLIENWNVFWESSGDYRHWCRQEKPQHTHCVVIILSNPGSLHGDGTTLAADTTLRILRRVGHDVGVNWLVLNLFDYAATEPEDLHNNWMNRDAGALVFALMDFSPYRFVIFAHGDLPGRRADIPSLSWSYSTRLAYIRRSLASLTEIRLPAT